MTSGISSSPAPVAAREEPPAKERVKRRILVVEDEALIALDLERRLLRAGYDVVGVADNREEAVERFQESPPDLILMDIFIKGPADGIETAKAIGKLGDVPIVFLTAYADDDTVRRASETSPYGYLLKPFDERTLSATITVALERHASDTRLRLLGAAVESASVGIVLDEVKNGEHKVSYVNPAFLQLSGATQEEVLGKPPCLLAANPEDSAVEKLRQALDNFGHDEGVIQGRRPNGDSFWSSVNVSPVFGRTGLPTHMLLFHADVSGQRDAEAALADSQRVEIIGRLTASIAHDFNNVLAAIVAFAELAREGIEAEGPRSDIDEVLHAARRGALLSRRLLDFSRRNEDGPRGTSNLAEVLGQTRAMAQRLAGPKTGIDLELDTASLHVPLDATSLEQIVLNMVANARDAMPTGGKVTIRTQKPMERTDRFEPGSYARLTVADNGTGIDEETQKHIFKHFFTTKPKGKGTGLGLATCKMLIERAGGVIHVESKPGAGTAFHMDLPLVEARAEKTGVLDTLGDVLGNAGGALCLVVEDEPALRRSAVRALTDVGFQVVEAATGEAAIAHLDKYRDELALLVCDAVLPGVQGVEVVARAREVTPSIKVLVTTGYFAHATDAFGDGVQMLWKPFTPGMLARQSLGLIEDVEGERTSRAMALRDAAPPSSKPPAAASTEARPAQPAVTHRVATVLLIEDDDSVRTALATGLESRGMYVLQAASGAEGEELHQSTEVDVAVIDVGLPDKDGIDMIAMLRARDPLLPTIIVTGDPTFHTAQRALQGRATGFLTKPIEIESFAQEIERCSKEGQVLRLQRKLLLSKTGVDASTVDLHRLETEFEASLAQLYMVYQPIVRPHDGSIFAFEALMRSNGPMRSPKDLLEAAEGLGRILDVGVAVRRSIANTLAENPQRYEPIFMNLHPFELSADHLLRPEEPLLPYAKRIVLEVTERAELSSADDVSLTMERLHDAGFRIALDDLGEGYAGLSWLVKLTPDIAKLDMSLVRNIQDSRVKRDLVASLVSTCRAARTIVVAEGVETEVEAKILTGLGCDLLQGYYFAKPALPFPGVN
ncbi:MAG: response regulator [Myxococcota bacterium]